MNRPIRQSRRGYTLVLTLLVLLLASAAMTMACRTSLRQAQDAAGAQEELQRRWGELTCRNVFLYEARYALRRSEEQARRPLSSLRREFDLGGLSFVVEIADEQSKPSANTLFDLRFKGDRTRTEAALRGLAERAGVRAPIALRPTPRPDPDLEPAFSSPGQIFVNATPQDMFAASNLFTCFGDGRLNFHRAGAPAIEQVCAPLLSGEQVRRIAAAGAQARPLGEALRAARVADDGALLERLADESACYSIWIVVGTRQRNRYYFTVFDGVGRPAHFEW